MDNLTQQKQKLPTLDELLEIYNNNWNELSENIFKITNGNIILKENINNLRWNWGIISRNIFETEIGRKFLEYNIELEKWHWYVISDNVVKSEIGKKFLEYNINNKHARFNWFLISRDIFQMDSEEWDWDLVSRIIFKLREGKTFLEENINNENWDWRIISRHIFESEIGTTFLEENINNENWDWRIISREIFIVDDYDITIGLNFFNRNIDNQYAKWNWDIINEYAFYTIESEMDKIYNLIENNINNKNWDWYKISTNIFKTNYGLEFFKKNITNRDAKWYWNTIGQNIFKKNIIDNYNSLDWNLISNKLYENRFIINFLDYTKHIFLIEKNHEIFNIIYRNFINSESDRNYINIINRYISEIKETWLEESEIDSNMNNRITNIYNFSINYIEDKENRELSYDDKLKIRLVIINYLLISIKNQIINFNCHDKTKIFSNPKNCRLIGESMLINNQNEQRSQRQVQQSRQEEESNKYYKLYIKYKNKYLRLKNQL